MMLEKPPHGKPCNQCGLCCMEERCPLGAAIFGPGRDCPALELRFPGFVCGLVANPEKYAIGVVLKHGQRTASEAAAYLVGTGSGCDALLEEEEPDLEWRARVRADVDMLKLVAAIKVWGLKVGG